jgi:hypothetical protein
VVVTDRADIDFCKPGVKPSEPSAAPISVSLFRDSASMSPKHDVLETGLGTFTPQILLQKGRYHGPHTAYSEFPLPKKGLLLQRSVQWHHNLGSPEGIISKSMTKPGTLHTLSSMAACRDELTR